MRIALDARLASSPVLSGTAQYARQLIGALGSLDTVNEYVLIQIGRDHVADGPSHTDGRFTTFQIPFSPRLLRLLWASVQLPRLGTFDGAQIMHALTHDYVPTGIRTYVATVHDVLFLSHPQYFPRRNRMLHRRNLNLTLRRASLVLTDSEHTAKALENLTGYPKDRIVVVPLAASPVFNPNSSASDKAILDRAKIDGAFFIFVGTFEPRKNVRRLIQAFRQARLQFKSPHRLLMIGHRGWLADEIMAEITAAENRREVLVRTQLTDEELAALMRSAVACVVPSLGEGFGLPVLEAMACGTPAITSDNTSLSEVAGGAALLVDPLDTNDIARAIVRVANDPDLQAELRCSGLERSRQFSWSLTAEKTIAAYTRSLSIGPPA